MVADSVAASMPLLSIWILPVSYARFVESKRPFKLTRTKTCLPKRVTRCSLPASLRCAYAPIYSIKTARLMESSDKVVQDFLRGCLVCIYQT